MKKMIFGALMALVSFVGFAGTPTARLKTMVDNLQDSCPLDVNKGWVIQTVSVDDNEVVITMIADTTSEQFAQMKANVDGLKSRFIQGFAAKARHDGLLAETMSSGLQLCVDIVSPESIETIALEFTPAELKAALGD